MTATKTLFDRFVQQGIKAQKAVDEIIDRPLSHRADPQTSYEAAGKMIKSGKLNRQEKFIWHWICNYIYNGHKDFTPKEVAKWLTIDAEGNYEKIYYTIQRRLSGLWHKGKIERLNTKGEAYQENKGQQLMKRNGCAVWRIVTG